MYRLPNIPTHPRKLHPNLVIPLDFDLNYEVSTSEPPFGLKLNPLGFLYFAIPELGVFFYEYNKVDYFALGQDLRPLLDYTYRGIIRSPTIENDLIFALDKHFPLMIEWQDDFRLVEIILYRSKLSKLECHGVLIRTFFKWHGVDLQNRGLTW